MFYTKDLDLNRIRSIACDQLLEGVFPSFSGSPDYDDFIRSVINEEAKIILGMSNVDNLEDVHDYIEKSSEFLSEFIKILDMSFTGALEIIQNFIESNFSCSDEVLKTGIIRKARRFYEVLQSPWFKIITDRDYHNKLLEQLKVLGKL